MRRIAVGLEYDGTGYCGWQIQSSGNSVEAVVSRAVSWVADQPVALVCAGRTDSGVHAFGQVAHFDTDIHRSERSWVLGANTRLAADVRVQWAREVPDHFHARFSALWREYRYRILNQPVASALERNRATWIREPLSLEPMIAAANCLVGERDFAAFRATACQSKSSVRNLQLLDVVQNGPNIWLRFRANAFLHHMVRNLAGWLIAVGRGDRSVSETTQVLSSLDRRLAAPTAAAAGLYFWDVGYHPSFGLPDRRDLVDP